MGKRVWIIYILSILLLLNILSIPVLADSPKDGVYVPATVNKVYQKTDVFNLKAKSSILMDADTGTILFEDNSHEKLPIASVTKVMSLLLVMEAVDSGKISLDDKFIASEHAADMGGTQVWLMPGEQFTVREYMYAAAIRSANDCMVALAECVAGSEEIFVQKMNEKAVELGMKDTNFLDCTGLANTKDCEHYSSAYDIALVSRELMVKHPGVAEFTTPWIKTFREGNKEKEVMLDNTNKLVRYYSGTIGIKTGFTNRSGFCLSAAVKRNNLTLISVVLGEADSNTRFGETRKLMDYGFANYESTQVNNKNEMIRQIEVKKGMKLLVGGIYGDDVKLLLKKGEKGNIERELSIDSQLTAPVKAGQKVGEVIYTINGKEVGRAAVISDRSVEKASFIKLFARMVVQWFGLGRQ